MSGVNYWAIVPAAGTGKRFGAELAKQFQPIGDKLVADHTLSRLTGISKLQKILVPCDTSAEHWTQVSAVADQRVELLAGGAERVHSVLNGLQALGGTAASDDWVLVHDMARPCITSGDINKLIEQLDGHSVGGILATPISDTLKKITSASAIEKTLDRSDFRGAQTPQMFRYGLLRKALETMLEERQLPTDEASAIEYIGEQAMIIEGRRDNIKITHREDLVIAQAIMGYQETEQCA
ncbi:MAG: 2-C-methyl-D-erythritol 4-phosphate cytidylyltransferase [Porticoccaceae bacterium]